MMGPLDQYRDGIARGDYECDEAQEAALILFQDRFDELCALPKPPSGFLTRLFRPDVVTRPVQGLYFWGGVGRGKTFLMDLFYESLPFEKKKRLHFHRFMREVHQQLHDLQGTPNPLKMVAANFARQARVICFDEFFVSDITDAMLLAGLLDALFDHGVTLIATSNVKPDNLYENGLQRVKFLPAIALLNKHTSVHNLDGGVDYRLRALESAEIYHYPLDDFAEKGLEKAFFSISPDEGRGNVTLPIEGRDIPTRRCGDGVVWFDFSMLCEGPRSQNDYIELARLFQTVLLGKVPQFDEKREDQARRFISLVDEFYDRNVKLIISAETSILDLYQGLRVRFEFARTESRLQEMQSKEYLSRQHKP
ncbi:MAG: cell division protein ZapE [Candidatus Azotimanducaceae bacterium]|jgi:cell division protein ZapE